MAKARIKRSWDTLKAWAKKEAPQFRNVTGTASLQLGRHSDQRDQIVLLHQRPKVGVLILWIWPFDIFKLPQRVVCLQSKDIKDWYLRPHGFLRRRKVIFARLVLSRGDERFVG